MKRFMKTIIILITIVMVKSAVFASGGVNLVTDQANLLTENQYLELSERATEISQKYKCDIAIITMEDMVGDDAYEFAKQLYNQYGMGYGDERSILLLFLSMEERDYALIAHGYGNIAFTDHGKDVMLDEHILPLLGKGDYYKAFSSYLSVAEDFLEVAANSEPFDIQNDPNRGKLPLAVKLGITFIIPILIAAAFCEIWRSQMKSAVLARAASNYITADGLSLTNRQDHFLYRTETRRRIESQSSGSSGGTTIDSSGTSGRSGKF